MKKPSSFFTVVLIFMSAISSFAAAPQPTPGLDQIVHVLDSQKIKYYLFANGRGNRFLVVPKFGGRVLAVSVGGDNIFWVNPDVLKGQGGQRTWLGPEGGPKAFFLRPDWRGFRDFSMFDPGHFEAKTFAENIILGLVNNFRAVSNDGLETYDAMLTRWFQQLDDPLAADASFKGTRYEFLGIKFANNLNNNIDSKIKGILDFWNIVQVPANGTAVIPVTKVENAAWRGNYRGSVPEKNVKANPDSFSFLVKGGEEYKVGVRPEFQKNTGTIGYIIKSWTPEPFLIVISFPVRPSKIYVDKPKSEQSGNGDAIQISSRHEQGELNFGELSCHSWAIDLEGKGVALFPVYYHIYRAPLPVLLKIGKKLVCPGFEKAFLF